MLSRRNDLRHEPDARMVEIGVYSTVGAPWYELPGMWVQFRELHSKGREIAHFTEMRPRGDGTARKRRERCSEDGGGQLTSRYHI